MSDDERATSRTERSQFADLLTGDDTVPDAPRVIREDTTGVHELARRAADACEAIDPTSRRMAEAIAKVIGQHIQDDKVRKANKALRDAANAPPDDDCAERLAAIEAWRATLTGADERNGRVGRLETDVRATKRWLKIATGALVSVLVAIAGSGWTIVDKMQSRAREEGRAEEWRRNVEHSIDSLTAAMLRTGLYPPVLPAHTE